MQHRIDSMQHRVWCAHNMARTAGRVFSLLWDVVVPLVFGVLESELGVRRGFLQQQSRGGLSRNMALLRLMEYPLSAAQVTLMQHHTSTWHATTSSGHDRMRSAAGRRPLGFRRTPTSRSSRSYTRTRQAWR